VLVFSFKREIEEKLMNNRVAGLVFQLLPLAREGTEMQLSVVPAHHETLGDHFAAFLMPASW